MSTPDAAGPAAPPPAPRHGLRPGPLAPRSTAPDLVALVAAAMCFLAVLALGAADGAARIAGAWRGGLDGAATVRLALGADAGAVEAALAALADAPGVTAARTLSPEEVAALLAPWLGTGPAGAPPAPVLIALTVAPEEFDAAAAQARLDAAAPGARLEDHGAWRARVAEAAGAFRRLAFASVALMGVALAAMVAAASRASLAGAAATVRTLRLLGAEDAFVARAFVRPIALRALLGGAAGALGAALAALALPEFGVSDALGAASAPDLWREPGGLALPGLVLAPLAAGSVAWAAARATVAALLARAET